jgi:hypothetical protein
MERLLSLYGRRPFEPFRIHVADGSSVEVKSPEFITVNPKGRTVEVASADGKTVEYIDLLLVTRLTKSP